MVRRNKLPYWLLALVPMGCGWTGRMLVAPELDGGSALDSGSYPIGDASVDVAARMDALAPVDAVAVGDAWTGAADTSPDGGGPELDDASACRTPPDPSLDAGPANSTLLLRYDFSGVGTSVVDHVSGHNGQVLGGAQLDCSGSLTLDGDDDFVDMPNGLVSPLRSASFMIWLTWERPGSCWERAFAFGSSDQGEGNPGFVQSSVSLTTSSCPDGLAIGMIELGFAQGTGSSICPSARVVQLTLVVDGELGELRVYIDGAASGRGPITHQLSQVLDVDNWLGRSNWIQDPYLRARLDEFRIYAAALSDEDVQVAYSRGPDLP